MIGSREFRTVL